MQLQGQPLPSLGRRDIARRLAYVPQSHVPSFPYSVEHIVAQGRLPITGLGRAPAPADLDAVRKTLAQLQIEHLRTRPYTELSGGEQQLVLIARALVQQAKVIILDEPITGLDFGHQLRLLALLQGLAEQGLCVLSSSHRPEHALTAANRVLVLQHGRLIADGAPMEVIDSALMQRLYQVAVRQIDTAGQRFSSPYENPRHGLLRLPLTPLLLSAAVHCAYADDLQLAPINVNADDSAQQQARDKAASLGPMGQRRLQDTPYSISVVPRDLTEDQQLKSFKDMIRYLPSVQGDGARPQTRGLQGSVVQNTRLDGLNVVSTTDYPAEQLGGVEVLSGLRVRCTARPTRRAPSTCCPSAPPTSPATA